MKKITFMLFAFLSLTIGFAQTETLAEWTPATMTGGTDNFGPSPFAASTTADDITVGGLTRGSGIGTTGSGAANGWGGNNFVSTDATTSISENEFVTFTVKSDIGYTLSIASIEPYNVRRSNSGPTSGQWQYQVGNGTFTNIGSEITWGATVSNAGNNQPAIDLSGILELQDIAEDTQVTFRILLWGASGTGGTWYLNGHNNATNKTLKVLGSVTEESTSTPVVGCDIVVNLDFLEFGDVTTWSLIDGLGNTVLSGGPYSWFNYDFSVTATHTVVNPPYSLEINVDDNWCDNELNYSVTVGGVPDISGNIFVCEDTVTQTFDIGPCPSCPTPNNMMAETLTPTSVELSWNSPLSETVFDVQWGLAGFTLGGGTQVTDLTSTSLILTEVDGVVLGTAYEFYVLQHCDTDNLSIWAGPYKFTAGAYTGGNIPTLHDDNPTVTSTYSCTPEAAISIEVPEGYEISSLQVKYSMTARNAAYMSEQYSFVYSTTLEEGEASLATNDEDEGGVYNYDRTMTFANGATGTVNFVLKAWRDWSGDSEDCNTNYNYVNNATWVIIPTFAEISDPCADIALPTGNTAQQAELGDSLSDLDITGTDLTWYSDEELNTEVEDSTIFTQTGTFTYYVTNTVGDCTSDAIEVVVTVTDPCADIQAPQGDSEQNFNSGDTLANLEVEGTNLTWYSDEEGTVIEESTLLVDGTTYYVSQTIDGCESGLLAITVTENLSTSNNSISGFSFYPNPVENTLLVRANSVLDNVVVFNNLGQIVLQKEIKSTEGQIDFSNLSTGSYIIKVSSEGKVSVQHLIKK